MANNSIADCPVCGYPIQTKFDGENLVCAYCNSGLISGGVTIPGGLLWTLAVFIAGTLLGPRLAKAIKKGV